MAQEVSDYAPTVVLPPMDKRGGNLPFPNGKNVNVVDINDLDEVHFPPILEQAYANAASSPWTRADMALDLRRAADVKTVINVADDDERVQQVCEDFILGLEEKLPTGEIDLPPNLGPTERAGLVARALIEEVAIAESEVNVDRLLITNAQLEYELDKYRKVRTVELAVQEIDARDEEIAALKAEVEQLRARQPGEVLRSGLGKIKALGRGVARVTIAR